MKPSLFTDEELAECETLYWGVKSPSAIRRIDQGRQLDYFIAFHGKEKYEAMVAAIVAKKAGSAKRRKVAA